MKRPSVRPTVCLSHRSAAGAACGGFAAERPAGRRSMDSRRRRSAATATRRTAANAGSVALTAELTRLNRRVILRSNRLYYNHLGRQQKLGKLLQGFRQRTPKFLTFSRPQRIVAARKLRNHGILTTIQYALQHGISLVVFCTTLSVTTYCDYS